MTPTPPEFRFDWNGLRDDHVGVLLSHSRGWLQVQFHPPVVGDVVLLRDEDESQFWATVVERVGNWMNMRVDGLAFRCRGNWESGV